MLGERRLLFPVEGNQKRHKHGAAHARKETSVNEKNAASAIYKTDILADARVMPFSAFIISRLSTVIIDFSAGKVKDGILTDFLKSALDRGGENLYDKFNMSNQ